MGRVGSPGLQNCLYPLNNNNSDSTEPEIIILPNIPPQNNVFGKTGKLPSFNPANWNVYSDDSSLDTTYVDDLHHYTRKCTEKLSRKRFRDKINRID